MFYGVTSSIAGRDGESARVRVLPLSKKSFRIPRRSAQCARRLQGEARLGPGPPAYRLPGQAPGWRLDVLPDLPADELVEVDHAVFHRRLIGAMLFAAVEE